MTTATQNENLMSLLMDAPELSCEAVRDAIRHVAVGDYRAASKALQFAADWYDEGNEWADRAERFAAILRAKANS